MALTADQTDLLNIAFNEATLLGVEVSVDRRLAGITLSLLSLPMDDGPPPEDPRVQLLLKSVGRVVASLRRGRWDDSDAEVESFGIDELLEVVQRISPLPIYGWQFFDRATKDNFDRWQDRLSFDCRFGVEDGFAHTLDLFQEGRNIHLDLRLWFDDLEFRVPDKGIISVEEIAQAGKRWWDGLYAGDPRTQRSGIYPLKREDA